MKMRVGKWTSCYKYRGISIISNLYSIKGARYRKMRRKTNKSTKGKNEIRILINSNKKNKEENK